MSAALSFAPKLVSLGMRRGDARFRILSPDDVAARRRLHLAEAGDVAPPTPSMCRLARSALARNAHPAPQPAFGSALATWSALAYRPPADSAHTARPRGGHDAPAWTRTVTGLARWIDGRASEKEIIRAMSYERRALAGQTARAARRSPRYRPERERADVYRPEYRYRVDACHPTRRGIEPEITLGGKIDTSTENS